ncbi:MAG: hypothetical protein AAF797_11705 [Planctomycetota bacterium]
MGSADPAAAPSGDPSASGGEPDATAASTPTIELSGGLKLGLIGAGAVMLVLPLLYAALVVFVGYATLAYVSAAWGLVSTEGWWPYAGLLIPVPVGPVLMAFLLRPFFGLFVRDEAVEITRQEEQVLFGHIDRLCAVLGVSKPDEVVLGLESKMDGGFSRSPMGALGVAPTQVYIGLPLAAGMDVQLFSARLTEAVVRAGLGNLARPAAVMRHNLAWLEDAAKPEDDAVDRWLRRQSACGVLPMKLVAGLGLAMFSVARQVVGAVGLAGRVVCRPVTRGLSEVADAAAARVAGSSAVERSLLELQLLSDTEARVCEGLRRAAVKHRLTNNLPAEIIGQAGQAPREARAKALRGVLNHRTAWLDTEPSARDRIVALRDLNEPGLFSDVRPARTLFASFDTHCKDLTRDHYRRVVGSSFADSMLLGSSHLVDELRQATDARQTLTRFAQSELMLCLPVPPKATWLRPPTDVRRSVAAMGKARQLIMRQRAKARTLTGQWAQQHARLVEARKAYTLSQTRFELSNSIAKGRLRTELDREARDLEWREGEVNRLSIEMEGVSQPVLARVQIGLSLLMEPELAPRFQDRPELSLHRVEAMVAAGQTLEAVRPTVRELDANLSLIAAATMVIAQTGALSAAGVERLQTVCRESVGLLSELLTQLSEKPLPFKRGTGGIGGMGAGSLGDALVDRVPDGADFMDVVDVGTAVVGRFEVFQARVAATICGFVEGVESALGLEALPQPSDDELIRPMLLATDPADAGGMVLTGGEPSRDRDAVGGAMAGAGAGLGSLVMATVVVAGGMGALMASGMITRVGSAPRPMVVADARGTAAGSTSSVGGADTTQSTGAQSETQTVIQPTPQAVALIPETPESDPSEAEVLLPQPAEETALPEVPEPTEVVVVPKPEPGVTSAEAGPPAVEQIVKPAPALATMEEALAALESGDAKQVAEGLAYLAYHEPDAAHREAVRLALGAAVRVKTGTARSEVIAQAGRWGGDHGMAFFEANVDVLQRSREAHTLLETLSKLEDPETLDFILDHAACWDQKLAVEALADRSDAVERTLLGRLAATGAVSRIEQVTADGIGAPRLPGGADGIRRPVRIGVAGGVSTAGMRALSQGIRALDDAGCLLAVSYLSEHGTVASVERLLSMRDHEDTAVRGAVMEALGRLAPRRIDAVGRLMEQMPTLGTVPIGGQSEAVAILSDLAKMEPDDRKPEVAMRLVRLMSSSDATLRSRAMTAAAAWPDPLYRPVLRKMLSDSTMDQASVPQAIAMLAENGGRPDAVVIGRWLIKEQDVVTAALISMGEVAEPVAMRHLTHRKPEVRIACLEILGEIGGRRSGRAVSARRSDPDLDVSLAAELAFAKLKARVEAAQERDEADDAVQVEAPG